MECEIDIIVAAGKDRAIGRGGDLVWHLRGDLKRFKRITMGHPVVMGRRTWESLPNGALPGRRNVVVTRNAAYEAPGAEVVHSLEEAFALFGEGERVFVIGGGEIYRNALPLARAVYMTEVDAECPDADTWFPHLDTEVWETAGVEEPEEPGRVAYRFVDYRRKSGK